MLVLQTEEPGGASSFVSSIQQWEEVYGTKYSQVLASLIVLSCGQLWTAVMLCVLYLDTHPPFPPFLLTLKETTTKHKKQPLKYCHEVIGQQGEEHLKLDLSAWQLTHCSPVQFRREQLTLEHGHKLSSVFYWMCLGCILAGAHKLVTDLRAEPSMS